MILIGKLEWHHCVIRMISIHFLVSLRMGAMAPLPLLGPSACGTGPTGLQLNDVAIKDTPYIVYQQARVQGLLPDDIMMYYGDSTRTTIHSIIVS
jgi:hypothetical protein